MLSNGWNGKFYGLCILAQSYKTSWGLPTLVQLLPIHMPPLSGLEQRKLAPLQIWVDAVRGEVLLKAH